MRHAAADDDRVNFLDHVADDADLVGDLCPTDDRNERALRVLERLADVVDLLLHQESRDRLDVLRHARIRGMRTMRNAKRIVHSDICERCELLCEGGIVLLLFLVIAQVLEQEDFARLQACRELLRLGADAVGCPLDLTTEELCEMLDEMLRAELILTCLGRTADVAGDDERRAAVEQIVQRRQRAHHARIVRDVHLGIKRNVVVHADEYLLALDVDILNCLFVHAVPSIKKRDPAQTSAGPRKIVCCRRAWSISCPPKKTMFTYQPSSAKYLIVRTIWLV